MPCWNKVIWLVETCNIQSECIIISTQHIFLLKAPASKHPIDIGIPQLGIPKKVLQYWYQIHFNTSSGLWHLESLVDRTKWFSSIKLSSKILVSSGLQCDQIVCFNIWPFRYSKWKFTQKHTKCYQNELKTLPRTKFTLNILPKMFNFFAKFVKFHQIWSHCSGGNLLNYSTLK